MDGIFISRSFEGNKFFYGSFLELKPYYFLQRSIKGNTNSFRAKNASILDPKEKSEILLEIILV